MEAQSGVALIARLSLGLCAIGLAAIYFTGWRDHGAGVLFLALLAYLVVGALGK